MTDKHTASRVRSRYQNKVLTDVELIIITSTQTYDELFCNPYLKEEDKQIKRRISTLLDVYEDEVIVTNFNEQTNHFEYITQFPNPMQEYVKTKKAKQSEKNKEEELKNWFQGQFIETKEKP